MNKILGYILSPIHHLFFFFFLILFQPMQWIALNFFGYKSHKYVVDLLNICLVSTYAILGSWVTFKNEYDLPTDRPIIFAANHQSMYDIPPIIWFLRKYHVKFISKIELTKGIPSISFNLKHGGGANIDRKDSKQAVAELIKFGSRMQSNTWSAAIFPEGTRSKDGFIKTFQIGGIATLIKKAPDVLIVPIAIENSWKLVKYGTLWLSPGHHIKFKILKPIEPKGKPIEDLVKEIEAEVKKELNQ